MIYFKYFSVAPKIIKLKPPEIKYNWCIEYEVLGNPLPNLTWYKNGKIFTDTQNAYHDSSHDGIDNRTGCLVFEMTNGLHNGIYQLVASNVYGTESQSVEADFVKLSFGELCLI